ncbi:PadR family transcriptional regulator [Prauserella marina]|uniref:DNA-binding transcriptional regulator, PadR family n=1 Tax=Prauserella marina TaxID=530584 RepID=A0A222VW56_9PSEU|nr:PadR family transcriptional regulator [Prauserella marina]ASR38062.1 PadR family transcriptional regulator [Prauserella marina]PWV73306.1 PadR family transcriptional regulator [Prauserella marina]SDD66779.1 DNA-binding transcriptional regulator, PadR family [Prauserella marina]
MSATRLLVLGVVRMLGTAHGYQVRRELLSWSADAWANVQPGSIYHALKKMAVEGLLDRVEDTEQGSGPDRVAYRLNERGESEFMRRLPLMLSNVKDDPNGNHDFLAALVFLPSLDRELAISLLGYRLTALGSGKANIDALINESDRWGQPPHVQAMYRLWQTQLDGAIEWLTGLIEQLRSGDFVMADDPGRSFGSP